MDKEAIQKLRRRVEVSMTAEQAKRLKRRILDYLFKYASEEQLLMIARLLSIKEN